MRRVRRPLLAAASLLASAAALFSQTPAPQDPPAGRPEAVIDLTTSQGVSAVGGVWRASDAKIVEADFPGPGPDNQPTGPSGRTYDIEPRAGRADFDDSQWAAVEPGALSGRRGGGRLSFNWYRITVTIPERIGAYATASKDVVFETTLDDAAEVWVDGELSRYLGQRGGSMVAGWNAPNRLVVGRHVKPGQKIVLAVFGINGPLSSPPTNFIYVRNARLEFYPGTPGPIAITPAEVNVTVIRKDPALDRIIGPNPKIWKLAEGFAFTEGPIWVPWERALLFSDPNTNVIYRYMPEGSKLSVFRTPSGYSGADIAEFGQPGSNGLTLDPQGRLTIDQHGNRRVIRLEKDDSETVLADRYKGRRLNSPNDLVYRSDGTLYFTDPPFGLPRFFDDPRKELEFSGVYALTPKGKLLLVTDEFRGPNGIAFSPDEKFLYVGNWDDKAKVVKRYPVHPDGALGKGEIFFDMTSAPGEDAIDGIKVDEKGNLYVSGPGGLWILSPEGRHLGTVVGPKHPHNMAWGDDDGKTLYLCAESGLYKMRLPFAGAGRPKAIGRVVRRDPRLDALLPAGAPLERVADGIEWAEGPAWDRKDGSLLFSDVPSNRIYRWRQGAPLKVELEPSGYTGSAPFTGREPGSNGLAFDREGRLVFCQHGNRRIVRRERDGSITVLADRYEGRRFNSPNDLTIKSNGDVYFTDPPFGLPGWFDDPGKEQPYQGVYRLSKDGRVTLLTKEVRAPNGIGFSPDEKTLYVANSDAKNPVWYAFEVLPDGTLGKGRIFHDASSWAGDLPGVPDSLKVDAQGNVWAAAPGGVAVFAPDGTFLGQIETGVATGNCAFGEDGRTLFVAASHAIGRIRTTSRGLSFP
jgi:gluconolactonase